MSHRLEITETCLSFLEGITDKSVQSTILGRVEGLKIDPKKQGKVLVKELDDFHSIHIAERYRVMYRIDGDSSTVWVLAIGMRKEDDKKDVYMIARKLLEAGLLDYENSR